MILSLPLSCFPYILLENEILRAARLKPLVIDTVIDKFQVQTASTASFLVVPGHNPLVKFSSVTSTVHSFLFRQTWNIQNSSGQYNCILENRERKSMVYAQINAAKFGRWRERKNHNDTKINNFICLKLFLQGTTCWKLAARKWSVGLKQNWNNKLN